MDEVQEPVEAVEGLTTDVVELLQLIWKELRAIHYHVGPTCPDFTEGSQNGNGKG